MISVVMINSRGKVHPDWVNLAKESVNKQTVDCEFIEVENFDRSKTIGHCWNIGVSKATHDYVLFLGDDDWLSQDYCSVLLQYALNHPNHVCWTSNMMAYDDEKKLIVPIQRICTGMWKKEYLLKHPFNEELDKGIDREYIEEAVKRNDSYLIVSHHFGYYYRKHNDYSCAGDINFVQEARQTYILASYRSFIDPIAERLGNYFISGKFDPHMADQAELIWCEWANNTAVEVANYNCNAIKILRVHAYEVFGQAIRYLDFSKFDKVIFVADHIKDYVETNILKEELPHAEVIPNGVDVERFKYTPFKCKNNKIAYAGYITRKKGAGLLLFLAESFPDYEFHVAGKFQEDDVAQYFQMMKPDNLILHEWQYNLPKFFYDKTYILNTSLREGCPVTLLEGMASGLKPLVYDWIGAGNIVGTNTFHNIDEFRDLLNDDVNPAEYREVILRGFNFENKIKDIKEIIEELKTNVSVLK